jgi:hypothetical protein
LLVLLEFLWVWDLWSKGHLNRSLIWLDRKELIIIPNIDSLLGVSVSNLVDWLASDFLQIIVHFTSFVARGMVSSTQCTLGWCIWWFCTCGCVVGSSAFNTCIWFCTVCFGVSIRLRVWIRGSYVLWRELSPGSFSSQLIHYTEISRFKNVTSIYRKWGYVGHKNSVEGGIKLGLHGPLHRSLSHCSDRTIRAPEPLAPFEKETVCVGPKTILDAERKKNPGNQAQISWPFSP